MQPVVAPKPIKLDEKLFKRMADLLYLDPSAAITEAREKGAWPELAAALICDSRYRKVAREALTELVGPSQDLMGIASFDGRTGVTFSSLTRPQLTTAHIPKDLAKAYVARTLGRTFRNKNQVEPLTKEQRVLLEAKGFIDRAVESITRTSQGSAINYINVNGYTLTVRCAVELLWKKLPRSERFELLTKEAFSELPKETKTILGIEVKPLSYESFRAELDDLSFGMLDARRLKLIHQYLVTDNRCSSSLPNGFIDQSDLAIFGVTLSDEEVCRQNKSSFPVPTDLERQMVLISLRAEIKSGLPPGTRLIRGSDGRYTVQKDVVQKDDEAISSYDFREIETMPIVGVSESYLSRPDDLKIFLMEMLKREGIVNDHQKKTCQLALYPTENGEWGLELSDGAGILGLLKTAIKIQSQRPMFGRIYCDQAGVSRLACVIDQPIQQTDAVILPGHLIPGTSLPVYKEFFAGQVNIRNMFTGALVGTVSPLDSIATLGGLCSSEPPRLQFYRDYKSRLIGLSGDLDLTGYLDQLRTLPSQAEIPEELKAAHDRELLEYEYAMGGRVYGVLRELAPERYSLYTYDQEGQSWRKCSGQYPSIAISEIELPNTYYSDGRPLKALLVQTQERGGNGSHTVRLFPLSSVATPTRTQPQNVQLTRGGAELLKALNIVDANTDAAYQSGRGLSLAATLSWKEYTANKQRGVVDVTNALNQNALDTQALLEARSGVRPRQVPLSDEVVRSVIHKLYAAYAAANNISPRNTDLLRQQQSESKNPYIRGSMEGAPPANSITPGSGTSMSTEVVLRAKPDMYFNGYLDAGMQKFEPYQSEESESVSDTIQIDKRLVERMPLPLHGRGSVVKPATADELVEAVITKPQSLSIDSPLVRVEPHSLTPEPSLKEIAQNIAAQKLSDAEVVVAMQQVVDAIFHYDEDYQGGAEAKSVKELVEQSQTQALMLLVEGEIPKGKTFSGTCSHKAALVVAIATEMGVKASFGTGYLVGASGVATVTDGHVEPLVHLNTPQGEEMRMVPWGKKSSAISLGRTLEKSGIAPSREAIRSKQEEQFELARADRTKLSVLRERSFCTVTPVLGSAAAYIVSKGAPEQVPPGIHFGVKRAVGEVIEEQLSILDQWDPHLYKDDLSPKSSRERYAAEMLRFFEQHQDKIDLENDGEAAKEAKAYLVEVIRQAGNETARYN